MQLRQPRARYFLSQLSILCGLLLVLSLACADVAQLSTTAFVVVTLVGLMLAGSCWRFPKAGVTAFGALLMVSPILGRGALTVLIGCVLIGSYSRGHSAPRAGTAGPAHRIVAVLFVIATLGLFRSIAVIGTWEPYSSVYSGGGFVQLLRFIGADISPLREAVRLWGYAFVALLLVHWETEDGSFQRFVKGLLVGGVGAIFYTGLQILRPELTSTLNYTPFWASQLRFSGTFSDPNAFGVMMTTVIPLAFFVSQSTDVGRAWRVIALLSAFAWLLLVPFSGSRTFWLGLALWLIVVAGRFVCVKLSRDSGGRRWYWGGLVFCLLGFGFLGFHLVGTGAHESGDFHEAFNEAFNGAPSGIQRVVQALDLSRIDETLESRIIYARLAKSVFMRSPIAGVGMGRFRVESEYASHLLGMNLGMWWDNANNYYLQVLAEQGVLGLIALVCLAGLIATYLILAKHWFVKSWLIIFFLLLVTGPHMQFEELMYLFTGVLGLAGGFVIHAAGSEKPLVRQNRTWLFLIGLSSVLLLFAVFISPVPPVSRGFYSREAVDGKLYAWTAGTFDVRVCDPEKSISEIEFRSLASQLAEEPARVELGCGGGEESSNTSINDNQWHRVSVPAGCSQRLSGRVSRLFIPGQNEPGGDPRALGVQLAWNPSWCPP